VINVVEPAAKHCTSVPVDPWQLYHTKNLQFFQCGCHDMSTCQFMWSLMFQPRRVWSSDTCCSHTVNCRLRAACSEFMTMWQVFLFKQFSSAYYHLRAQWSSCLLLCISDSALRWTVYIRKIRLTFFVHEWCRKVVPVILTFTFLKGNYNRVLFSFSSVRFAVPPLKTWRLGTDLHETWHEHCAAEISSTYIHVNFILTIGP
jgi:hypothetical protein